MPCYYHVRLTVMRKHCVLLELAVAAAPSARHGCPGSRTIPVNKMVQDSHGPSAPSHDRLTGLYTNRRRGPPPTPSRVHIFPCRPPPRTLLGYLVLVGQFPISPLRPHQGRRHESFFAWGSGFMGTHPNLPPKFSFSSDFGHFILKMLDNAKF